MRSSRRSLAAVLASVVVIVLPLAACGDDDDSSSGSSSTVGTSATPAAGEPAAAAALEAGATVIDVRTPEEYDAGHIRDAQLLNIQADDFQAGVDALDPEGVYVVYCRSGNRSAVAAKQMEEAGLSVYDGGALDDMVAAGWPTD